MYVCKQQNYFLAKLDKELKHVSPNKDINNIINNHLVPEDKITVQKGIEKLLSIEHRSTNVYF